MGGIEDDKLSYSGSPRFGTSEGNSDEEPIRNRINNPRVASFWKRTMCPTDDEGSGSSTSQNLKLNSRWSQADETDEATGVTSQSEELSSAEINESLPSQVNDTLDDISEDVNTEEEEEDAAENEEIGTIAEDTEEVEDGQGQGRAVAEATDNDDDVSSSDETLSASQDLEAADRQDSAFEGRLKTPDRRQSQPPRFAWWTKGSDAAFDDASSRSSITDSKKQAALECLTDRLQIAIKSGADQGTCSKLVEAIKLVTESIVSASSIEDNASGMKTTHRSTSRRSRGERKGTRKHKRSPSNREIREGLLALTDMIEQKLNNIAVQAIPPMRASVEVAEDITPNSAKSSSVPTDGSKSAPSLPSNGDIYAREQHEMKLVMLEQESAAQKTTIEELKSLISAQNANLQSTLEALENIDKDRLEKTETLIILRETEKKRAEFIVALQKEVSELQERLDRLGPQADTLKQTNEALRKQLVELHDRFEEAQRMHRGEAKLLERIESLELENRQLEADVVKMIKCCTEYKGIISELQNRIQRKPQRRRGCNGVCQFSQDERSGCEVIPTIRKDMAIQTMEAGGTEYFDAMMQGCDGTVDSEEWKKQAQSEIMQLQCRLQHMEDARRGTDEIIYLGKEENKLLKSEMNRLSTELRRRESRISELEFMLDCEAGSSNILEDSECLKSVIAEEDPEACSTRESFGWWRNMFGRSGSGSNTPTFGSNSSSGGGPWKHR